MRTPHGSRASTCRGAAGHQCGAAGRGWVPEGTPRSGPGLERGGRGPGTAVLTGLLAAGVAARLPGRRGGPLPARRPHGRLARAVVAGCCSGVARLPGRRGCARRLPAPEARRRPPRQGAPSPRDSRPWPPLGHGLGTALGVIHSYSFLSLLCGSGARTSRTRSNVGCHRGPALPKDAMPSSPEAMPDCGEE